jgi:mannosyltransferase OCH1-like enzyme
MMVSGCRSESWKKLNPTWEYRFWTDADNDKFVKKYYPEFLKSYEGMPYPINRADMIRCVPS